MRIRVAAVQYHLHGIDSFEAFAAQVEHYVKTAAEFAAEYVLFPEFFTTQLLSIPGVGDRGVSVEALAGFTGRYLELFTQIARDAGMYIAAGTHVVRRDDRLMNVAHLFYPDGRVSEQPKLHITPTERDEWRISGGDAVHVFDTGKMKVALLTCYDIEFPEIVRMAVGRGADVVLCPSCTDDLHGFYRVRYCCHARCVENQVYVVTSGTVGTLQAVDFMRANTGQAAILAPNDVCFPPRGVIAEGELNHDMVVVGDLDLDLLREVRAKGSVTTWRDRRTDLYPDLGCGGASAEGPGAF
ncbi:MAG: carbon-nitrogen hydrolase family protein [Candidatus Hydrogenedentes bacterium]|nr:carbon-nitrogen hydrolase family protein [Candidatus Hydrogenedentota bacterium]